MSFSTVSHESLLVSKVAATIISSRLAKVAELVIGFHVSVECFPIKEHFTIAKCTFRMAIDCVVHMTLIILAGENPVLNGVNFFVGNANAALSQIVSVLIMR